MSVVLGTMDGALDGTVDGDVVMFMVVCKLRKDEYTDGHNGDTVSQIYHVYLGNFVHQRFAAFA